MFQEFLLIPTFTLKVITAIIIYRRARNLVMHRLAQVCIELSPTVLLYNICDLICNINDEIDRNAIKQMILEFSAN